MKKILMVVCFLALTFCTVPSAFCQDDIYASFLLGVSQPTDSEATFTYLSTNYDETLEYEVGFGFAVAAGKYFGSARLEGEIGYYVNNYEDTSSDLKLLTLMLNGYYDFNSQGAFTPYLTGGLGLASAKIENTDTNTESDNDAVVVYQAGAGIAMAISDTTDIDFRYRYMMTSDLEFNDLEMDFASHVFFVGLSKRF